MSNNTWNFPCWQCKDEFPATGTAGQHGNYWLPGSLGSDHVFTTDITCLFSFLAREGWTADTGIAQFIMSIGSSNINAVDWLSFYVVNTAGVIKFHISSGNFTTSTYRYQFILGDENGTGWMTYDKWYQIGIVMNDSGISFVVNGSTTPTQTITTNNPSTLPLWSPSTGRLILTGPSAIDGRPLYAAVPYQPSVVLGAAAYAARSIDLTDSVVRNRIWDTDGNFKNPGEDGSLWFSDTYGNSGPEYYFADGTPRRQNGTNTQLWNTGWVSSGGYCSVPGGLRKQYEP